MQKFCLASLTYHTFLIFIHVVCIWVPPTPFLFLRSISSYRLTISLSCSWTFLSKLLATTSKAITNVNAQAFVQAYALVSLGCVLRAEGPHRWQRLVKPPLELQPASQSVGTIAIPAAATEGSGRSTPLAAAATVNLLIFEFLIVYRAILLWFYFDSLTTDDAEVVAVD